MSRIALTGSRIRERRLMLNVKQADLAQKAEISPSYLNLIEHNRRRIAGKLLARIAEALDVEPAALTEGAEAALISRLREAAATAEGGRLRLPGGALPEIDRVEEFAGRFPGWAALLAAQVQRVAGLERTVEELTDRLTHDPFLSAALHDILTTVTAIRSTSSILTEEGEISREWRDRFQRNIHEDSQRLTDASQSLVTYLDTAQDGGSDMISPQEELAGFLRARDYHIAELEADPAADPAPLLDDPALQTASARALAQDFLTGYAKDAARLKLADLLAALRDRGADPASLADMLGTDLPCLMRRLAALPPDAGWGPFGLAICDASGTLTLRKSLPDFQFPRFGAACPLWPLFQALSTPLLPIRADLLVSGRGEGTFSAWAVAHPAGRPVFGAPPRIEATMLIVARDGDAVQGTAQPVGISCRICPRRDCEARREPSILAAGL